MNTCENSLLDVLRNVLSSNYMVERLVDFTYGGIACFCTILVILVL
jgi:hypothetical protein